MRLHRPIVCVGHAALDRVFTVDSWPTGSAKIAAAHFEEAGGGMAANAAVAIARLGGDVLFCGPTGDDVTADAIEAQLRAEGIDVAHLRRCPGVRSSTSAVLIDAHGERLVVGYRSDALQTSADWLPLARIASAGAVLADVRWPAGAAAALQAARDAGVPAVLDGEVADRQILRALGALAEHVVFSERGLQAFADHDLEAGLRAALEGGARVAAVTQGARGVLWMEAAGREVRHCPAFRVPVVDTLAAGDVFHGAYALALAEGQPLARAIRFASAAAAIKCTRRGGRGGAPSKAEVETFLRQTR